MSILIVVDLPLPLGPRNPKTCPRGTSKLIPSTAVKSPKRLVSPRTEMAAAGSGAVPVEPGDSHRLLRQPPAGGHHRSPKDQDREGGEHQ